MFLLALCLGANQQEVKNDAEKQQRHEGDQHVGLCGLDGVGLSEEEMRERGKEVWIHIGKIRPELHSQIWT